MPAHTKTDLIAEFENYIKKNGGYSKDYGWYVAVTSDPEARLFRQHGVNKSDGAWIYADASSDREARQIERYLLSRGAKGGLGGGDTSANYIYAYRINWYTEE